MPAPIITVSPMDLATGNRDANANANTECYPS
jgi:hypothetical protein